MSHNAKNYEWLVSFEIRDMSVINSDKWCMHSITLIDDKTPRGIGQGRKVYGSIAVETQSNIEQDAIKQALEQIWDFLDVLAVSSPMVGYFSGFPQEQNLVATCTNEEDIIRAGQFAPTDTAGFYLSLTLEYAPSTLTKTWTMWRKLDTLPNVSLLRQLMRFYRMGRAQDDAYLKLFNFWISFNALYRRLSNGNDVSRIRNFVNFTTQNDPNKISKVVDIFRNPQRHVKDITPLTLCLAKLNSNDLFQALARARLRHSQALSSWLATSSRELLEESLLCVYDVRNNYFHGHMTPTDLDLNRDLVYVCCVFLDYMLQWGINCWLHDEASSIGLAL